MPEISRAIAAAISLVAATSYMMVPSVAFASTESELESAKEELGRIEGDEAAALAEVESLSGEIAAASAEIESLQERKASTERSLAAFIRSTYKAGGQATLVSVIMSSSSISEVVEGARYVDETSARLSSMASDARQAQEDLRARYAEVSAAKDAQEAAAAQLASQREQVQGQVDELEERLEQEKAAAAAAAAAASSASASQPSAAKTFATGDTSGWRTGIASAYGGWSDPSTGAVCSTATGDICDDWSMGVAVPMAWPDYRSYFNRQVEISYGGQSVIATVNDCGYMGGGSRSLDLQPGVFKAFGFYDCDSWGLRTVSYRFL